jgi:uncharacterized protein YbaP (TraB family)
VQIKIGRLIAATFSAVLALFASPVHAEPAMWVVKDADSTIYLLGTFHLIKPDMNWRSNKIDAAFKDSDELWLEATVDDGPAQLQDLVLRYGIDRKQPLSSKLSGEDWTKTQSAATRAGLPIVAIEQMRPWLAGLALTVAPMIKDGYAYEKGADLQLERDAKASNKVVKTFETAEQQVQFFAGLSEEAEVVFLMQSVEMMAASSQYVDQMANAWISGNSETLDRMVLEAMKAGSPELYDALIVRRNMDWCDQIATIMKGAGTSFVAVGAGHLVGDQSVPAILAKRGFTVTPY